jgi:hypothetical protein
MPTFSLRMRDRRHHLGRVTMLELRPNCECCDRDLPPDSTEARICSYECTFCRVCAEGVLGGSCPNCGGELVRRPIRPLDRLLRHPASTRRVSKPEGCARA